MEKPTRLGRNEKQNNPDSSINNFIILDEMKAVASN